MQFIMNVMIFRSAGAAVHHERHDLQFSKNCRSAWISLDVAHRECHDFPFRMNYEFQELPFIMNVMIFRSARTAAQHKSQEPPLIMLAWSTVLQELLPAWISGAAIRHEGHDLPWSRISVLQEPPVTEAAVHHECHDLPSTGTFAQHEFQELQFIMNVMIFRSAGAAAQHEYRELPFIMTVTIFRTTETAAQHEFQELPFIMNVMIFSLARTAARHELH